MYDLSSVAGWVTAMPHEVYKKSESCGNNQCCRTLGLIPNEADCKCGASTICNASTGRFCSRGFTYVGCYKDEVIGNDRNMVQKGAVKSWTLQECSIECAKFAYFSLQNQNECRCGNSPGNPHEYKWAIHRSNPGQGWDTGCGSEDAHNSCPNIKWKKVSDSECGDDRTGRVFRDAVFANDPDVCTSVPVFAPGTRHSPLQSNTNSGTNTPASGRYLIHPDGTYFITQAVAEKWSVATSFCFHMYGQGNENPTKNLHLIGIPIRDQKSRALISPRSSSTGKRKPNLLVGSSYNLGDNSQFGDRCREHVQGFKEGLVNLSGENTILTFTDIAFQNHVSGNRAARIRATNQFELNIVRCDFENVGIDSARRSSESAVLRYSNSHGNISGSSFRGGSNPFLIIDDLSTVEIHDTVFQQNARGVIETEGIVTIKYSATLKTFNSLFDLTNLQQDDVRGIHASSHSIVNLHKTNFTNAVLTNGQGGAVAIGSGSSGFASHCLFENNRGTTGGALHLFGALSSFTLKDQTILRNNQASISGGGAAVEEAKLSIEGGTIFEENSCSIGDGGGLHVSKGGSVNFGQSTFRKNSVKTDHRYASSVAAGVAVDVEILPSSVRLRSSNDTTTTNWIHSESECAINGRRMCALNEICSTSGLTTGGPRSVTAGQTRFPYLSNAGEQLYYDMSTNAACPVVTANSLARDHDIMFCCLDTFPDTLMQNIALNKPTTQSAGKLCLRIVVDSIADVERCKNHVFVLPISSSSSFSSSSPFTTSLLRLWPQ